MKSILIASFFALAATLPTSAQEYQGCFMIDASRRLIQLPELCPQVQPISTGTVATEPAYQPLPANAVDRVAAFYAGRYCDQRETGTVSRQDARSEAGDWTQNMMEQLYGIDATTAFIASSWGAVLDAADRSIAAQCPGS